MKLLPKQIDIQGKYEIRPLSLVDGRAIFDGFTESISSLKQFMQWAHYYEKIEDALSVYADFEAKSIKGELFAFAGFKKKGNEFLFCTFLYPSSRLNNRSLDIGYWVSTKHQGKGFGTMAAKAMILLANGYFLSDRISILCNPDNISSRKVIEKCGFHFEGRLRNALVKPTEKMVSDGYSENRDLFCYSLLQEEVSKLDWVHLFYKEMEIISYAGEKISLQLT